MGYKLVQIVQIRYFWSKTLLLFNLKIWQHWRVIAHVSSRNGRVRDGDVTTSAQIVQFSLEQYVVDEFLGINTLFVGQYSQFSRYDFADYVESVLSGQLHVAAVL